MFSLALIIRCLQIWNAANIFNVAYEYRLSDDSKAAGMPVITDLMKPRIGAIMKKNPDIASIIDII